MDVEEWAKFLQKESDMWKKQSKKKEKTAMKTTGLTAGGPDEGRTWSISTDYKMNTMQAKTSCSQTLL